MTLVDTSIWVDHFRRGNARLAMLLENADVLIHPFIIGELSLGYLKNRAEILSRLSQLPRAAVAEHEEVLALVEKKSLVGFGIGWVDAHLLASTMIEKVNLLTNDKPLQKASRVLGVCAT